MTDKQIIKLKSMEDLDEKIIKEKGNTKCIFYADDICRNGDRTRDCINCARVEYHSLYSLNWDNQERLQKIIKHKEQECEELNKTITNLENIRDEFSAKLDQLKKENEELKNFHINLVGVKECEIKELLKLKQTLTEIKEIIEPMVKNGYFVVNEIMGDFEKILQKINEVENVDND